MVLIWSFSKVGNIIGTGFNQLRFVELNSFVDNISELNEAPWDPSHKMKYFIIVLLILITKYVEILKAIVLCGIIEGDLKKNSN